MGDCVHVRKSRNLNYFEKPLTIKTAISSNKIEIRGKPDKFKKK